MQEKINIEEILQKNLSYSANILKNISSSKGVNIWKGINDSILEFGKQLLELAAENSSVILYIDSVKESSMKKHCIHRNNMEYIYTNDKQSILDTIKQVE